MIDKQTLARLRTIAETSYGMESMEIGPSTLMDLITAAEELATVKAELDELKRLTNHTVTLKVYPL